MAVIKVACPKCGQKVSGDESFYGRPVNCPICTSRIVFPEGPSGSAKMAADPAPIPPGGPPNHDPRPPHPPESPPFGSSGTGTHAAAPPSEAPQYPDPPSRPNLDDDFSGSSISSGEPSLHFEDDEPEVPSPLLGIVSLVVGVLNTVTVCIPSILLVPVAIVCGHAALARAKHSPVKPAPGHTHAVIGVILGYAGLIFTIFVLVGVLIFKDQLGEVFAKGSPDAAG